MISINNILKKFLTDHNCDTKLFDYVLECKNNLKKEYINFIPPIFVETSIKIGDNNQKHFGRYIITINLEEFLRYTKNEQTNIFKLVHLDINNYIKKLHSYKKKVDIIFGYDGNKGKVYFDEDDKITCYESSGKIKYYVEKYPHIMYVYENNVQNEVGKHIRIIDKNNVPRWYAHMKNYTTIYYRPNIEISENEKKHLSENDLLEYKHLINWFYHGFHKLYQDKI